MSKENPTQELKAIEMNSRAEYKGFHIQRESMGRFGTTFRYRCGSFIAPRKKDVINEIDRLLKKRASIELELSQLNEIGSRPTPASVEGFDLIAHLERQMAFSKKAFGPDGRLLGVIDHIKKETAEIEADPTDREEWADLIILAFDGAWRSGLTAHEIAKSISDKLTINEARTWPDWKTSDPNKAIEHDRSKDPVSPHKTEGDKGLRDYRLRDSLNWREQVYLDCWKKMFDGKEWQLVDKPTPRDLSVMLTMVQWLGTNVGQQFLRESQLQSESQQKEES